MDQAVITPSPPPPTSQPMIETHGLTARFGTVTAVDGLALTIGRGELFGLVGPDGAGKTTTLRLLVGALAPAAGAIRVAGVAVPAEIERVRPQIGYVAQRFAQYGDLTVDENLRFTADLFGVPGPLAAERADRLLALTGLSAARQRRAEALSGGMKQKLALACALIHEPALLVLDEPTNGVDPVARREFWRLLVGLLAGGTTVLVATAYLDEAELCGRLGFMAGGRLLMTGTPDQLRSVVAAALLEVHARPRQAALALLQSRPEVRDVRVFGDRLHVMLSDELTPAVASERLAGALTAAGLTVERLRPIRPSLEDAVIQLMQAGAPREDGHGG